jgi:hypothetical protein
MGCQREMMLKGRQVVWLAGRKLDVWQVLYMQGRCFGSWRLGAERAATGNDNGVRPAGMMVAGAGMRCSPYSFISFRQRTRPLPQYLRSRGVALDDFQGRFLIASCCKLWNHSSGAAARLRIDERRERCRPHVNELGVISDPGSFSPFQPFRPR